MRAAIARDGEIVVTERGRAAHIIKPYLAPKKRKAKPEPFDYDARLIKRIPKPISAAASKAIEDLNRGER
ncbi:MAG: hypothetical protein HY302_01105 [Opitutae bacterium]|nr:hypothetical protein [Opitutae bacterium]